MNFVKGMVTGAMVGAAFGVMNSTGVMRAMRKGKKNIVKFRRRMAR